MKVEVVLTEADIALEFAEAIEARDLPEKFFFWFTRSAAEWLSPGANMLELWWRLWRLERNRRFRSGTRQTLQQ